MPPVAHAALKTFQLGIEELLSHDRLIAQIASSLNSPNILTRKSILDILVTVAHWNNGEAHGQVVAALEVLSSSNNMGGNFYAYWFHSMENSLAGRGKMGSLVGASEEVRRIGGTDSSLNEYAVCLAAARSFKI